MLQGSLDNFALDEVLGLLSSTSKNGRLEITGDRGTGSLLFDSGKLVGAEANHTPNGDATEDVMFELLRFKNGTFTFTSEAVTSTESARDLTSVLTAAETRLKDWRSIESVVPSLSHVVTPVPELPAEEVTISRAEWSVLNVIAAGCPASLVCEELGLGEVEGSRRIKDLAERSLVNIGNPLGSTSLSSAPPTPEDSYPSPSSLSDPLGAPGEDSYIDSVPPPPAADAVLDTPPSDSVLDEVPAVPDTAAELIDSEPVKKNKLLDRYLKNDD